MNETLAEAFKRFSFLGLSDLMQLLSFCTLQSYDKGEVIAREGDYYDCVLLIRKGIIRTYVLTTDGEERTIKLAREKEFTSCAHSFLYGQASREYLVALEEVKVVKIDAKKLRKASEKNINILKLTHEGIKEAFLEAIQRVEFFTILSPEERYKKLLAEAPDLLQRVPQKYLASYLGITTVSLSRIKSRLAAV